METTTETLSAPDHHGWQRYQHPRRWSPVLDVCQHWLVDGTRLLPNGSDYQHACTAWLRSYEHLDNYGDKSAVLTRSEEPPQSDEGRTYGMPIPSH
ncbi:hypothetical protein ACFQJ7_14315 [Halovenus rubra]|uniref:Uncharacterized protein n=2 Tax=Halovenus rubra TaxID=869890 RepID=A0ABD5X9E0_9EURY|nr:hypothetical protein [Halovenus rubra]